MRTVVIILLSCLLVAVPVIAQDALPDCEVLLRDLSSDLRSHIRLRDERVDNLVKAVSEVGDSFETQTVIDELLYWAVMADSAAARSADVEYPECLELQSLDTAFDNLVASAYAAAGQAILSLDGGLSDFQLGNVSELFVAEIEEITANVVVWKRMHESLGGA